MTARTVPAQHPVVPGYADVRHHLAGLPARAREFLANVVLQRRVLGRPYAGVMHLLLFWGVTIQVVGTAINLMQMRLFTPFELASFPRGGVYLTYELVMDLAGLAILGGVGMAAWRRLAMRPATLVSRWDDYYALALLALIPVAGFVLEALRLIASAPPWAGWSPIGDLLARLLLTLGVTPELAATAHDGMFWVHAVLGLLLVASIPFTKFRHLVTTPLHILTRPRPRPGTWPVIENIEEAEHLGVGTIREFTSSQLLSFDACVRCGRCADACPVVQSGTEHAPHEIVQSLRAASVQGLLNGDGSDLADRPLLGTLLAPETPWYCTTCGACVQSCPAFVNPVEALVDLRRYQVMTTGDVPKLIGEALRNFERQGNPWGMPVEDRGDRVRDLGLRVLQPGESTDVLWFLGCAFAFDERNAKAAKAFLRLLDAHGVSVATLGDRETCCGEQARRLGHEYLFQEMARQNIETLSSVSFDRIVTQCPHCYNTLKHEYRQLGAELEVLHYTELLATLPDAPATRAFAPPEAGNGAASDGDGAASGDTRPAAVPPTARVTYHDSCYLGRYNDVYAAPRALLDRAGLSRVEMRRSGANSFCCGGGGGQMWQEIDPDRRINNARLQDAVDVGADVVATACPYCLLMFDDAIRSTGVADTVKVMDIAEVLASRLDG